jgi:hypothetical protein
VPVETGVDLVRFDARGIDQVNGVLRVHFEVQVGRGNADHSVLRDVLFDLLATAEQV